MGKKNPQNQTPKHEKQKHRSIKLELQTNKGVRETRILIEEILPRSRITTRDKQYSAGALETKQPTEHLANASTDAGNSRQQSI